MQQNLDYVFKDAADQENRNNVIPDSNLVDQNNRINELSTWLQNRKSDFSNLNDNCKEIILKAIFSGNSKPQQKEENHWPT